MWVNVCLCVCVCVYLDISAGSCRNATADCPFSKQCTCPYYVSASPPSFSLCLPSILPVLHTLEWIHICTAIWRRTLLLWFASFCVLIYTSKFWVPLLRATLSSSPALSRWAIISRNATRCLLRLGHTEIHIIDVCMCVYIHTELLSNYAKHELCPLFTCVCVLVCVCV